MEQVTNSVLLVGEDEAISACLRFLLEGQTVQRCRLSELTISLLRDMAPRVVLFLSFKDKERTVRALDMVRWFSSETSPIIFTGTELDLTDRFELDRRGVRIMLKPDTKELIDIILERVGA